ncbi:MAG: alpha/beta hydrolase fold protein [Gammaproteobacteria bacterium]|nr:alpha/beta hydrolase fold protein [Gammaproteobacteria bacterium]
MKIKSQFEPKKYLKSPHLQTILTQYLVKSPLPDLQHEIFELSDGDFVEFYFAGDVSKGLVIILHGILGALDSHYAAISFEALASLGLGGVFVSARGAGEKLNRTPRFFNAADTKDLQEIILHLRQRFPNVPLFAIGYSLGGVILTKWLGEYTADNPLKAAMAVSIPFDLKFSVEHFSRYPGKLYSDYMIRTIRRKMLQKFSCHDGLVDLQALKQVRTFPEFDNLVTAPINGYTDAHDYYQKGSPKYYLKSIQTPLLIVHAKDDPFSSSEAIPAEEELSEFVTLEVSEHGGHLGFISEIKQGKPDYWLVYRIKEYLGDFFL